MQWIRRIYQCCLTDRILDALALATRSDEPENEVSYRLEGLLEEEMDCQIINHADTRGCWLALKVGHLRT